MTVEYTFKLRRGTAAAWTTANPVLAAGEPGVETDTDLFKFGDGTTAWTVLDYAGSSGGAATLDDLTDVTITAGASGDIIRHNGTAWVDAVGSTFFDAAGAATTAQTAAIAAAATDATTKANAAQAAAATDATTKSAAAQAAAIASAATDATTKVAAEATTRASGVTAAIATAATDATTKANAAQAAAVLRANHTGTQAATTVTVTDTDLNYAGTEVETVLAELPTLFLPIPATGTPGQVLGLIDDSPLDVDWVSAAGPDATAATIGQVWTADGAGDAEWDDMSIDLHSATTVTPATDDFLVGSDTSGANGNAKFLISAVVALAAGGASPLAGNSVIATQIFG